jgi:hypothetical protein
MPSARLVMARVGQTSAQIGSWQWLQASETW